MHKRRVNESIADTIIKQIGGKKALYMLGAKQITYSSDGDKTVFNIPNKGYIVFQTPYPKKGTYCIIFLRPDDTYTVLFYRIKNYMPEKDFQVDDVYYDQLIEVIESYTGAYLSL